MWIKVNILKDDSYFFSEGQKVKVVITKIVWIISNTIWALVIETPYGVFQRMALIVLRLESNS